MKITKSKILVLLLILVMTLMTACGGNSQPSGDEGSSGDAAQVNMKDMLTSLFTNQGDLGLAGKYTSTSEIEGAAVDPELVGTWITADQDTVYVYNEDGTATAEIKSYGMSNDTTFTCMELNGFKLVCEDMTITNYNDDGEEMDPEPIVGYSAYKIENDVLYMVSVDEYSSEYNQTVVALTIFYRADESSDNSAAVKANPLDISALYGEWSDEDTGNTFVFDENGLTINGGEPMEISFNDKNELVVETEEGNTAYSFNLVVNADLEDAKITDKEWSLGVFYVGDDENDRPNLADYMTDWNKEYDYDTYNFSLNLYQPMA